MSRLTCSLGLLLVCCSLVLSIPPPEAGNPLAMMQFNPFLARMQAPAANAAPTAAAATAPATTTLPPSVANLIAKYKAAAAAFYPTVPMV